MINEALLGISGLYVSDGRLAQRADFKLFAVGPGKCCGAQPARPVTTVPSDFCSAITGIVMYPDIAGDRALHGMSDIINEERIAVTPAVKITHRRRIASQKRSAESGASARVGSQPKCKLDSQKR